MDETAAYRLQSSLHATNLRLGRAETEVSDLRAQILRVQSDLDILRAEMSSRYVPWTLCLRVLDVCTIGMSIIVLLAMAHGFKMI